MEKLLTQAQKNSLFKRQRLLELKQQGLKHEQVWLQLNEELQEKGIKSVSMAYIYKHWTGFKDK